CVASRIVFRVLRLVHPVPSDPPELGALARDTNHMSRTRHSLHRGYCRSGRLSGGLPGLVPPRALYDVDAESPRAARSAVRAAEAANKAWGGRPQALYWPVRGDVSAFHVCCLNANHVPSLLLN